MTTLEALAAKVEQASGPSLDLDHAIHDFIGDNDGAPLYTASLDAAMSLVPEGLEYRIERRVGKGMHPAYASIWSLGARDIDFHANGYGKSPPLALCSAALRARAASPSPSELTQEDKHGE